MGFQLIRRSGFSLLAFLVLMVSGCSVLDELAPSSSNSSPQAASPEPPKPVASSSPSAAKAVPNAAKASPKASPKAKELGVAPQCPSSNPVKGKVEKKGKVYHVPKSPNYNEVKPEICFPNAAAAEKAGYRAAGK